MNTTRIIAPVLAFFFVAAPVLRAQPAAPAEAPTASAVKPAADLCKGVVDPYDPVSERARFFKAAGVDNELSAAEFTTARGAPDSFVRPFDKWTALLAFDKNTNQTLDWFEADAYRRNVRQRMLDAFDTNKNGSLQGDERTAANKALAGGKIPATKTDTPPRSRSPYARGTHPNLPPAPPSPYWRPDRNTYTELRKKLDTDGDGRLTREQWREYSKALREMRTKWQLEQYDANNDGTLDEKEREAQRAKYREYSAAMARRSELYSWDKNRNGKLDPEEKAALLEYKERVRKQAAEGRARYEAMVKKHDADGDGKLNTEERKAYYEDYRQQAELRRWDTDKDGQLSEAEAAARDKQKAEWKRRADAYRKNYLAKWDKDGDGKVSREESQARYKEYRRKRLERWDADGDGELSAEENKAMYAATRARYAKERSLMDANGDGQLTTEEYREYYKKRTEKYDTNDDGYLDSDEREKLYDDLDKMPEPKNVPTRTYMRRSAAAGGAAAPLVVPLGGGGTARLVPMGGGGNVRRISLPGGGNVRIRPMGGGGAVGPGTPVGPGENVRVLPDGTTVRTLVRPAGQGQAIIIQPGGAEGGHD